MELRRSHRIRGSNYAESQTSQATYHEEEEGVVVKSRKRPNAKLPEVESIDKLVSAKRQKSQFVDKSDQLQLVHVLWCARIWMYITHSRTLYQTRSFTVICAT